MGLERRIRIAEQEGGHIQGLRNFPQRLIRRTGLRAGLSHWLSSSLRRLNVSSSAQRSPVQNRNPFDFRNSWRRRRFFFLPSSSASIIRAPVNSPLTWDNGRSGRYNRLNGNLPRFKKFSVNSEMVKVRDIVNLVTSSEGGAVYKADGKGHRLHVNLQLKKKRREPIGGNHFYAREGRSLQRKRKAESDCLVQHLAAGNFYFNFEEDDDHGLVVDSTLRTANFIKRQRSNDNNGAGPSSKIEIEDVVVMNFDFSPSDDSEDDAIEGMEAAPNQPPREP